MIPVKGRNYPKTNGLHKTATIHCYNLVQEAVNDGA